MTRVIRAAAAGTLAAAGVLDELLRLGAGAEEDRTRTALKAPNYRLT